MDPMDEVIPGARGRPCSRSHQLDSWQEASPSAPYSRASAQPNDFVQLGGVYLFELYMNIPNYIIRS